MGETQRELATGSELVVLDGLRHDPHPTHMHIEEAVKVAKAIDAPQTYFIHMTHHVDHDLVDAKLPEGINLAYDGLRIQI